MFLDNLFCMFAIHTNLAIYLIQVFNAFHTMKLSLFYFIIFYILFYFIKQMQVFKFQF